MSELNSPFTLADLDIDAVADGIIAHRSGASITTNPEQRGTMRSLSWTVGWTERMLALKRLTATPG